MALTLRYHRKFRTDVKSYAEWFEDKQAGLGDAFVQAVDVALDKVVARPLSYRAMWGDFRRVLIRRFHIIIPFEIVGDRVHVLGVVHGSRDLAAWLEQRTGDES